MSISLGTDAHKRIEVELADEPHDPGGVTEGDRVRMKARTLVMGIAIAMATGTLSGCASTVERCDVDRSDYPLAHTLPNGRTVKVFSKGHGCGSEARPIWVRVEQDGNSCALGYRCQGRSRGR